MTGFPPTSPTPPPPPPPPESPFAYGAYSVSDAFDAGWNAMKANYGVLLGGVVVAMLINFGLAFTVGFIPIIGAIAPVFITWPVAAGLAYMGVQAARGERVQFETLFFGFKRYWPVMGVNALMMLIMLGCLVPMGAGAVAIAIGAGAAKSSGGGGSGVPPITLIAGGIGAMLCAAGLLAVLVLYCRLMFAQILCIDPAAGRPPVTECLRLSWRFTKPVWGSLIGMNILLGLVAFGTFLLCGVGLLFLGAPLSVCVLGAAYCMVVPVGPQPYCPECGYDLSNINAPQCPECGYAFGLPA